MTTKTAVVLFNLGGPDSLEAVEPFLANLFNDPAIIGAPGPIRRLLSRHISRKRGPVAREIYAQLGGKSPLVEETAKQAAALEAVLGEGHKVFVAMRYWHPFASEALAAAKAWGAERVVLLPLYPQFSTTTTRSSLREWRQLAASWQVATEAVCCYPDEPGLVSAIAQLVRAGYQQAERAGRPRILFSAHGLPQRVVDKGDPYPKHVEQTARAVIAALDMGEVDWMLCYQSRVGPLKWIGPSTEEALERAGEDGVPVVVVPIAFVSEHSETLVELDIEYRHRAESLGIPAYVRVAAVGHHPDFIAGLARLVRDPGSLRGRGCAGAGGRCPFQEEA
ncbi:MAG TPA: ferrochelatase [Magnetospirillum sp.]|jgi:ferrochelatase|nr:ferrochelatase [Magnetospirillum sp.]